MTDSEIPETSEAKASDRPQQFLLIEAWLHGERERVLSVAQDWSPPATKDTRDIRDAQLLGETLLRMQSSLGSLSQRHDLLEGWRL